MCTVTNKHPSAFINNFRNHSLLLLLPTFNVHLCITDIEATKALDVYLYCSPLRQNHSGSKRAKATGHIRLQYAECVASTSQSRIRILMTKV